MRKSKSQNKRLTVTLKLSDDHKELLQSISERESRSLTQQIEHFIKKQLATWDTQEGVAKTSEARSGK